MEHTRPIDAAHQPLQRAATAPTASTPPPKASPPLDSAIETLYNHPSVKITAFTASRRPAFQPSPSRGILPSMEDEPGSLSWSSQLERTIAVGAFRIYRAPGSVAFLSCGSALQPILPKSQCWCMDEESSKFVLQIRRPQYWRIELPISEPEDVQRAEVLRDVLDGILQFETTPCPFKRPFTIELPEPQTPLKKRPWRPVRKPCADLPPTPGTSPAPKSALREEFPQSPIQISSPLRNVEKSPCAPQEEPDFSHIGKVNYQRWASEGTKDGSEQCDGMKAASSGTTGPFSGHGNFKINRAVTLPPQLTLHTSAPSKNEPHFIPAEQVAGMLSSISSVPSSTSFHSTRQWHSPPAAPLPPSPPLSDLASPTRFYYSHDDITALQLSQSQDDRSDLGVTPKTQRTWDVDRTARMDSSLDSPITTPPRASEKAQKLPESVSATPERPKQTGCNHSQETPRPRYRHRATTSSISVSARSLSPLPAAVNLFSPPAALAHRCRCCCAANRTSSRLDAVRRLPATILTKTCELLLGPSSNLLRLMLKVAARIAAGQWRGLVFGLGEDGEQINVRWDYSDDEDDDLVDDFAPERGVGGWADNGESHTRPRSRHPSSPGNGRNGASGRTASQQEELNRSWEVD